MELYFCPAAKVNNLTNNGGGGRVAAKYQRLQSSKVYNAKWVEPTG